jgi:hypothetical protein
MKKFALASAAAALLFAAGYWQGQLNAAAPAMVYELRTYTTHPGKLDALNARFRNHTTKLFEKHGMVNIGYWTPQDAPLKENTLIYIIAHKSRDAAKASWDAFRKDPEWQQVAKESEKDGKINQKVESVFLDPVDYSKLK